MFSKTIYKNEKIKKQGIVDYENIQIPPSKPTVDFMIMGPETKRSIGSGGFNHFKNSATNIQTVSPRNINSNSPNQIRNNSPNHMKNYSPSNRSPKKTNRIILPKIQLKKNNLDKIVDNVDTGYIDQYFNKLSQRK